MPDFKRISRKIYLNFSTKNCFSTLTVYSLYALTEGIHSPKCDQGSFTVNGSRDSICGGIRVLSNDGFIRQSTH